MEKLVDEHGELRLKRTPNMQYIMNSAYSGVALVAIARGTLTGAWEFAIKEKLKSMYKNPHNRQWLDRLLNETGVEVKLSDHAFDKASWLITQSVIPKHERETGPIQDSDQD